MQIAQGGVRIWSVVSARYRKQTELALVTLLMCRSLTRWSTDWVDACLVGRPRLMNFGRSRAQTAHCRHHIGQNSGQHQASRRRRMHLAHGTGWESW